MNSPNQELSIYAGLRLLTEESFDSTINTVAQIKDDVLNKYWKPLTVFAFGVQTLAGCRPFQVSAEGPAPTPIVAQAPSNLLPPDHQQTPATVNIPINSSENLPNSIFKPKKFTSEELKQVEERLKDENKISINVKLTSGVAIPEVTGNYSGKFDYGIYETDKRVRLTFGENIITSDLLFVESIGTNGESKVQEAVYLPVKNKNGGFSIVLQQINRDKDGNYVFGKKVLEYYLKNNVDPFAMKGKIIQQLIQSNGINSIWYYSSIYPDTGMVIDQPQFNTNQADYFDLMKAIGDLFDISPKTAEAAPAPTLIASIPDAAMVRLATFANLGNFKPAYAEDGKTIVYKDSSNKTVATLDEKSGGVLRVSPDAAPAFAALDNATKTQLLKADAGNGNINAIVLPGTPDNGSTSPPSVAVLDAKGNAKTVQGLKAVADFAYDVQTQKILAQFPDGSGYYYVNPDGKPDFTPAVELGKKVAADMDDKIKFPDATRKQKVKDAIAVASGYFPFGMTIEDGQKLLAKYDNRDFVAAFNNEWAADGITFQDVYQMMIKLKTPQDLMFGVKTIDPVQGSMCTQSCWRYNPTNGEGKISISDYWLNNGPDETLVKEAIGSKAAAAAQRLGITASEKGNKLGEQVSFWLEAVYVAEKNNRGGKTDLGLIKSCLDDAYKGGYPGK